MTRVLVVSGVCLYRNGLATMLGRQRTIEAVATAASVVEVELDRNFTTTLTGPSGSPMTANWSTSIRIQNGSVTRNTVS